MKAKFLTGLVATTAAIATSLIGGAAQANPDPIDPIFYDFLVNNFLLQVDEGEAVPNHQAQAVTGQITALGDRVDVYFLDHSTANALYTDRLVYTINDGSLQQGFLDYGSGGLGGRLDDSGGTVPDGAGFSFNTTAGDILDFNLWTTGFNTTSTDTSTYLLGGVASENIDGLQHAIAYNLEFGGDQWTYIGFEDIPDLSQIFPNPDDRPGGFKLDAAPDFDFNDVAIVVRNVRHIQDVPEPGITLALLGVAAGAMGLRRRKDTV